MGISSLGDDRAAAGHAGHLWHRPTRLPALAREHWAALTVLLVCLAWLLPGLFGRVPWKPDEAYTVAIIAHFYRSHEWLVPVLGGQPFMEKPPLFYWTATGFAWLLHPLLGLNAAARFATLFYMLVTLAGVWLWARELCGSRVARLAPLVLLSCLGLLYRGHELFTDIGLLAGFALAGYGMALSLRRALLGGLWLGIGTGIGFLCKGLIAPGILGLIFLCLPLLLREYRTRRWWLASGVALFAAAPWLLIWLALLYRQAPALFHAWFWNNNLGRFFGWNAMGGAFHDRWYYAKLLPWMSFPAWPLALYALWRARANWRTPAVVLPAASALAIIVVLQVSRSTNDVYALPLLLPLAVLGAFGITQLPKPGTRLLYWAAWLLFGLVAVLLWLAWFGALAGRPAWLVTALARWLPVSSVSLEVWALAVAALYSAAWVWLGLQGHSSGAQALRHWTLGAALVWCLAMSLWLAPLNAAKSYAAVMTAMGRAIPARHNCIVTWGMGDSERGMLAYYAGVNTEPSWTKGALRTCDLMLLQGDQADSASPAGWRPVWQGARNDARDEYFRLLVRDPAKLPLAPVADHPYVGRRHHPLHHRRRWDRHGKLFQPGHPHQARTVTYRA